MSDGDEIEEMLEGLDAKLPKDWEKFTREQKLEFIAHRMLINARTSTKHSEMKEEGWLSDYQMERRRRREVLSKFGDWSEIPPKPGVFGRTYSNDIMITPGNTDVQPITETKKEEK